MYCTYFLHEDYNTLLNAQFLVRSYCYSINPTFKWQHLQNLKNGLYIITVSRVSTYLHIVIVIGWNNERKSYKMHKTITENLLFESNRNDKLFGYQTAWNHN